MSSNPSPRPRVVLLGASNLARAMSTVVETARLVCGGPCRYFIALGHGRSYGVSTRVLARRIPGILPCGLWDALDGDPNANDAPTYALVTDVGNDVAYGYPAQQIVDWLGDCVDRLRRARAHIVATTLPLMNLQRLSPQRFVFFRAMLFPGGTITLAQVLSTVETVNAALRDMAERRLITLVEQQQAWYGFDPIHIRMRFWPAAFRHILDHWIANECDEAPSTATPKPRPAIALAQPSLRRWVYLRMLVPQERRMFGVRQRRRQPAGRLADGSTIAMY